MIDRTQGRVHVNVRIEEDDSHDYSWLGEFVKAPTEQPCYCIFADAVRLAGSELWRDRRGRIVAEPVDTSRHWRPFKFQYIALEDHGSPHLADLFADADRLVGLSRGDWGFIGIVATVSVDHDGYVPREIGYAGLWGIESDSGEYLRSEARDLAREAISDARAFVRELVTA